MLYFGNLSWTTSNESLRSALAGEGHEVRSVSVVADRRTGRSRGFAFVELGTAEQAEAVLQAWSGRELDGRVIKVGKAIERIFRPLPPPRGSGGRGFSGGRRRR